MTLFSFRALLFAYSVVASLGRESKNRDNLSIKFDCRPVFTCKHIKSVIFSLVTRLWLYWLKYRFDRSDKIELLVKFLNLKCRPHLNISEFFSNDLDRKIRHV